MQIWLVCTCTNSYTNFGAHINFLNCGRLAPCQTSLVITSLKLKSKVCIKMAGSLWIGEGVSMAPWYYSGKKKELSSRGNTWKLNIVIEGWTVWERGECKNTAV